MTEEGWEFQPHGGPFALDELKRRYPQLDDVAIEIRKKCIASPLYLADKVLSNKWDRNLMGTPSEAHRLVEKAMLAQRDTLYVDSRGTAKTTLLDEVGTVHQFLRFPNDTQLLTHSSIVNAKSLSASVRLHLRANETFRNLFPEYAIDDKSEEGNILAWSVPCRTLGGREESVEISTPGTSSAGRHYNVVRCSDWCNENTTPLGLGSLEMMRSLVDLFSQVLGLLKGKSVSPRAHWTVDSNRWHDADLAGTIIRKDVKNTVEKIVRGVTGESGNFVSSWPEVIKPWEIQEKFDSPAMTPAMFAANFRGDPLPDDGMAFKREWFKTYSKMPENMDIAITVDPAFSGSDSDTTKTDRSAIVVSGIAEDGHLYVLETLAGRWGPNEFTDKLWGVLQFWQRRDPGIWVGIEDIGGSRGLKQMFLNEMLRTGRYVPYRDLPPKSKRKDIRIAPLHSHAQHFGIHVKAEHNDLIEELLRFGVAEHDDLADAFAYRIWNMYQPQAAKKTDDDAPKRSNRMTGEEAIKFISGNVGRTERWPWDSALVGRN